MKQIDEQYGPLEWRLPEASAIYWAAEGLERAKQNPNRIGTDPTEDLIVLRRVIYQCMQLSWQRGRIEDNPFVQTMQFGLIDCQMVTEHLASLGARPVPRVRFSRLLAKLVDYPAVAASWAGASFSNPGRSAA